MGAGLSLVWIVVLSVAAAGAMLLLYGLRGRRLNTHPHCRRCGFDLIGIAQPGRCPECGADLARQAAIRTGARTRRPAPAAVGGVLLLAALLGGGALLWSAATNFNWNTVKPDWLLLLQARHQSGVAADPGVLAELSARIRSGALKGERTATLVARALSAQADPATPWIPEWGSIIESARGVGAVSDTDWGSYFTAGIDLSAHLRRRIHSGEPVTVSFGVGGARLGPGAVCSVSSPMRLTWLTNSAGERMCERREDSTDSGEMQCRANGTSAVGEQLTFVAPPGAYQLHGEWSVEFREGAAGGSPSPPLATSTWETTLPVTIVPPEEPLVVVKTNEKLRDQIRGAITLRIVRPGPASGEGTFDFEVRELPADTVFNVSARPAGSPEGTPSINIGSFAHPRINGHSVTQTTVTLPPGFAATSLDFTLTPDPVAASQTTDLEEIWGGTIIIQGVPVEGPRPGGSK